MKLLISSIFLLLLAPCNKSKSVTSSAPDAAELRKTVIVYECTPCFGKCPQYKMTVDGATNMMTFVGKSNTDKIGTYTKPVKDEELIVLLQAFEKAGFDTLNEKYLGNITDFPSKYITLTYKDKTKKVQDRSEAPERLHELEKTLEAVASSEGWMKQETGN
jgi:hypothetical protein